MTALSARAACTILLALGSCAHRPGTTVEQGYDVRAQPRRNVFQRVMPPRCAEIPTAEYPRIAPGKRPEQVAVRVDVVIDSRGRASELEAEVLEGPEVSDAFVAAALAAASDLRCQPAVRTPRPGSGEVVPQPVAYKSSLIYRFHRDGRPARGSF